MPDTGIQILTLGTPRLLRDGSDVSPDTRKATALVSYLAVEGPTRRDTLAALLWPESADSQARATLRRTLSAARSALGPEALSSDRNTVRLGETVASDYTRFLAAMDSTRDHDHGAQEVCSQCVPLLESAISLYRGDFLSGFSLRDSASFEDWARATAEACRLMCESAYEKLAVAHASEGNFRSAITTVNQWLEMDPLREPAYRQLMLMHAWAGDGPAAGDAYRRCVATLDRELGVGPLEETSELLEAILDNDLPPAPGIRKQVVPTAPPPPPASTLLNRETALEAMSRVVAQDQKLLRIEGGAWMGKTRLLEELETMAGRVGRKTIRARAHRSELTLPYGVIAQSLAGLAASPTWETLRNRLPSWALDEVSRIAPSMGGSPADVDPDPYREIRLREALTAILGSFDGILIFDDLHYSDAASISLLGQLAERIEDLEVSLVGAHRPDDTTDLQPFIEMTTRQPKASLMISPLGTQDIEDLAGDAAAEVVEATGGVPALVADAITSDSTADSLSSIRTFMEAQLTGIDELAGQVLAAAAVLGRGAGLDDLRVTSGRSDEEVTQAIDWLIARRVLKVDDRGGVEFVLDAIEALVEEEAGFLRTRLLHRRAATALQGHGAAISDRRLATSIARHLREGGQDEEAADWYHRAGDLAMRVFAPAEAIESYRSSMALGNRSNDQLHIAIGDADLLLGRYREALTEFEQAAAMSDGETRALAEHRIGEAHRRLGEIDRALGHFEVAEESHPDPVALYSDWALAHLRKGETVEALSLAEQGVAASNQEHPARLARALTVLGTVTAEPLAARRLLQEALDLAGDDPILRVSTLNALAHAESKSGNADTAIAHVEEALELSTSTGDKHRRAALYNHLADLHHAAGRTEEAESALKEAVRLFVEVEPGSWEPEVWLLTHW